ncbi:hypothetical protein PJ311_16265 [Bacillus sp. CLL-7-23]|uniref:Uncharacterized protein n=1 Tax=Bacillus changyiensis TaxID=3004103 RepID=A0ABT4X763_9BACI|nr:hypothetical protein [Bacillus changyiensis]MDA7028129.1 hypothetical protein [Bacillus changyiensis]
MYHFIIVLVYILLMGIIRNTLKKAKTDEAGRPGRLLISFHLGQTLFLKISLPMAADFL